MISTLLPDISPPTGRKDTRFQYRMLIIRYKYRPSLTEILKIWKIIRLLFESTLMSLTLARFGQNLSPIGSSKQSPSYINLMIKSLIWRTKQTMTKTGCLLLITKTTLNSSNKLRNSPIPPKSP